MNTNDPTVHIFRKGRRKDKDANAAISTEEQKEYLDDPNIKDRISDADFFRLVALPQMLDLNEWLATHSEYPPRCEYPPPSLR